MKYQSSTILIMLALFFICAPHMLPIYSASSRPKISLSLDRKTIFINNKPFIPKGIWNPFVTELGELSDTNIIRQRISDIGNRGFNMFILKADCNLYFTVCKNVLDQLAVYNNGKTDPNRQIWVFFSVQDALYTTPPDQISGLTGAKAQIAKVYNYPYFLGMLLGDEPDSYHLSYRIPPDLRKKASPSFLHNINNLIKQAFPDMLTFINLAKSDPLVIKEYVGLKSADIIAHTQHYYKTNSNYTSYQSYLPFLLNDARIFVEATKDTTGAYQLPVWGIVHTFGNYVVRPTVSPTPTIVVAAPPTQSQHTAITQTWLEAGVTGIFYYTYRHPNWILANPVSSVWPNTSGDFGSPEIWNNFSALNNNVGSFIDNRHINNPACLCQGDTCHSVCSFNAFSGITYIVPLKCSISSSLFSSSPSAGDKNSYCRRLERTKGDADGDGIVSQQDYFYYVGAVNGGKIPTSVNPDFNGDGEIGITDRGIIVNSITGQ